MQSTKYSSSLNEPEYIPNGGSAGLVMHVVKKVALKKKRSGRVLQREQDVQRHWNGKQFVCLATEGFSFGEYGKKERSRLKLDNKSPLIWFLPCRNGQKLKWFLSLNSKSNFNAVMPGYPYHSPSNVLDLGEINAVQSTIFSEIFQ